MDYEGDWVNHTTFKLNTRSCLQYVVAIDIVHSYSSSVVYQAGQYHINMKLIIRQYGVHTSIVVDNYSNQNHMPWCWKFIQVMQNHILCVPYLQFSKAYMISY